jgi:LacI family transcriptional regulator
MKKRSTIRDVAAKAGCSVSTVSLVINNSGYTSEATKTKVLAAIQELGYHPTRSAKGLASKTSGNIGFILSDDHFSQVEQFYTKVFLGTEFEARKHSYYVLLTTVGKKFKDNGSIPRFLLERNVDGVIIAGKIDEKLVEFIDNLGVPIVLVDYELPRKRISSVLIDNRKGARLAVLHLVERGHKKIAFIGGDLKHPSIADRFTAYEEALVENGITPDESLIVTDEKDTRVHNGDIATERLFKRGGNPSGIFAANDAMAIGCMQRIRQCGKSIPRDIAIVGFDDIEMSSHVEPRLTTIRVFKEDMGSLAVKRLVDVVKSKTGAVVTTHVPVELVIRASTGASWADVSSNLSLPYGRN